MDILVPLTKTSKRATRDHKSSYIQEVRDSIDEYDSLYLFSYENMRSSKFKDIRMHFCRDNNKNGGDDMTDEPSSSSSTSKIMLGKNKLLQIALGKSIEDEYHDNLHFVSKLITSHVGLLFTSKPTGEVMSFFENYKQPDFARAGNVAPRDVYITSEMVANQPVTMLEQQFQKQKLPIQIVNGKLVIMNQKDKFRLCKHGETLSVEQCNALKTFGIMLSEFHVQLLCRWSSSTNEFEKLV